MKYFFIEVGNELGWGLVTIFGFILIIIAIPISIFFRIKKRLNQ